MSGEKEIDYCRHLKDPAPRVEVPVVGLGQGVGDGRHVGQVAAHLDTQTQELIVGNQEQQQEQRLR